jgi:hypothetical protein
VKDLQTSFAFYRAAGYTVRFQRADPPFAYLDWVKPRLCLSGSTSAMCSSCAPHRERVPSL